MKNLWQNIVVDVGHDDDDGDDDVYMTNWLTCYHC